MVRNAPGKPGRHRVEIHDIRVGKTYIDARGNKREVIETSIRHDEFGLEIEVTTIITIASGKSFLNTTTRIDEIEKWEEFVPSMMTDKEIIQKFAEATVTANRALRASREFIGRLRHYSVNTDLDKDALALIKEIDQIVGK